jgi:hypothetical protein
MQLQSIVRRLSQEKKQKNNVFFFGARDSGMEVVFKVLMQQQQQQQQHGQHATKLSPEEKKKTKAQITAMMMTFLRAVLLKDTFVLPCNLEALARIILASPYSTSETILNNANMVDYNAMAALWDDPQVKGFHYQSKEHHLPECPLYFFEELTRIAQPEYNPTELDLLYLPQASNTSGVAELPIKRGGLNLIEVKNQQGDASKWIDQFETVDALVYVVSLKEFGWVSGDHFQANKMKDTLAEFERFCNGPFAKAKKIVFFNHGDQLERKLSNTRLSRYFPEYQGKNEKDAVVKFFEERFSNVANGPVAFFTVNERDSNHVKLIKAAFKP